MELSAKGQNGVVTFDGQFVTIERKGFLAASTQGRGTKRIPISQITAVQVKPAGRVTQGFISFTIGGSTEKKSRAGRQSQDAFQDENSLVFLYKSNGDVDALRAAVESAIAAGPVTAAPTAIDQISKLAELHATGVLTDSEFAAAKAKALGL